MLTGGNESQREYKGLWPHFTWKSSNHLKHIYVYMHRSALFVVRFGNEDF